MLLSAKNATQQTGSTTQSQGTGNAGALRVTAGSVQVLDGAQISSTTHGAGRGGICARISISSP